MTREVFVLEAGGVPVSTELDRKSLQSVVDAGVRLGVEPGKENAHVNPDQDGIVYTDRGLRVISRSEIDSFVPTHTFNALEPA